MCIHYVKQSFRITDYEKVIIYKTIVISYIQSKRNSYNYHEVYYTISFVRNSTYISAGGLHETVAQTHTYTFTHACGSPRFMKNVIALSGLIVTQMGTRRIEDRISMLLTKL